MPPLPSTMSDMDMMQAMGISGFGKKTKARELDPMRFEKTRRDEVSPPPHLPLDGPL